MKQQTLRLKIADQSDIKGILRLVKQLFGSSVYASNLDIDEEHVKNLALQYTQADQQQGCIILLVKRDKPVGLLACSHMPLLFNPKYKSAVELAFWIEPEYRNNTSLKMLLGAYKYWAKRVGCTHIMYGKMKSNDISETYTVRKL